jgi:hypothetical protein
MKRKDFIKMYSEKTHLGDGLYVQFDGYHFILSAKRENGWHWVGLEPPVFENLIRHRRQVYENAENLTDEE